MAAVEETLFESINVSAARNIGQIFDKVIHSERPVRIVRWKRDAAILSSQSLLETILEPYTFHVQVIPEGEDGFTLVLQELDVAANGPTLHEARAALLRAVRAYCRHYMMRWDMYVHVPETRAQLPYVLRLGLVTDDASLARLLFGSRPTGLTAEP